MANDLKIFFLCHVLVYANILPQFSACFTNLIHSFAMQIAIDLEYMSAD